MVEKILGDIDEWDDMDKKSFNQTLKTDQRNLKC